MVEQNLANLQNLEDLKIEDILWNEDSIKIKVKFRIEDDIKNFQQPQKWKDLKMESKSKWRRL